MTLPLIPLATSVIIRRPPLLCAFRTRSALPHRFIPVSPTNSSGQQSSKKKSAGQLQHARPLPPRRPRRSPHRPLLLSPGWAFQELAAPHGRPRRRRPRRAPPPLAAAGHQTTAAGAACAPRTRSTWPPPRPPGTAASHPRSARASQVPAPQVGPSRSSQAACLPSPYDAQIRAPRSPHHVRSLSQPQLFFSLDSLPVNPAAGRRRAGEEVRPAVVGVVDEDGTHHVRQEVREEQLSLVD